MGAFVKPARVRTILKSQHPKAEGRAAALPHSVTLAGPGWTMVIAPWRLILRTPRISQPHRPQEGYARLMRLFGRLRHPNFKGFRDDHC